MFSANWPQPFITCEGVPKDARIVGVLADAAFAGTLDLVIESEEFKPDPPGCALTRITPMFTCYTSYQSYLEVVGRTETKEAPPVTDGEWAIPAAWLTPGPANEAGTWNVKPPAESPSPAATWRDRGPLL